MKKDEVLDLRTIQNISENTLKTTFLQRKLMGLNK